MKRSIEFAFLQDYFSFIKRLMEALRMFTRIRKIQLEIQTIENKKVETDNPSKFSLFDRPSRKSVSFDSVRKWYSRRIRNHQRQITRSVGTSFSESDDCQRFIEVNSIETRRERTETSSSMFFSRFQDMSSVMLNSFSNICSNSRKKISSNISMKTVNNGLVSLSLLKKKIHIVCSHFLFEILHLFSYLFLQKWLFIRTFRSFRIVFARRSPLLQWIILKNWPLTLWWRIKSLLFDRKLVNFGSLIRKENSACCFNRFLSLSVIQVNRTFTPSAESEAITLFQQNFR